MQSRYPEESEVESSHMMNPLPCVLLLSMPGPLELLLIFLLVLLLFGARRLPEIAKGLGQAIQEFKKAFSGSDKGSEKEKE